MAASVKLIVPSAAELELAGILGGNASGPQRAVWLAAKHVGRPGAAAGHLCRCAAAVSQSLSPWMLVRSKTYHNASFSLVSGMWGDLEQLHVIR
jgi:hypothetical protein